MPCSARSRGPDVRAGAARRPRPRPQHPLLRDRRGLERPPVPPGVPGRPSPGPDAVRRIQHGLRVRRPVPDPARLRHVVRVHSRHQPRPLAGPAPGRKPARVPGRPEPGHHRAVPGHRGDALCRRDLVRGRHPDLRPRLEVGQVHAALAAQGARAVRHGGGVAPLRARAPARPGRGRPLHGPGRARVRARLPRRPPGGHERARGLRPAARAAVDPALRRAALGRPPAQGPALRLRGRDDHARLPGRHRDPREDARGHRGRLVSARPSWCWRG